MPRSGMLRFFRQQILCCVFCLLWHVPHCLSGVLVFHDDLMRCSIRNLFHARTRGCDDNVLLRFAMFTLSCGEICPVSAGIVTLFGALSAVRLRTVKALTCVEWLLPGSRRCPKVVCYVFFRRKSDMLCFFFHFFAGSSSIIAFVATQQLCRSAARTKTPCGVRYVACHVQVALLLSYVGPPWSQWCSDWCALGCSATVAFGCVCSSHVSGWLRSVEVFAAVARLPRSAL